MPATDSAVTSRILLLGAPGTGAHALADALAGHLATTPLALHVAHSALMDALQAGDAQEQSAALDAHRCAAMTLLMGLDLPCPTPDQKAQHAADAQLRAALGAAAIGYRVVYGPAGPARLRSALRALGSVLGETSPVDEATAHREIRAARLRAYGCEKCSDPVCEHRLFTALTRTPAPDRA